MINILKTTNLILGILFTVYGLYHLCLILIMYKKDRKFPAQPTKNKFAILIPARNEEMVIGALLDSLNHLNYPKELYDVYVAANNCTDNTAAVALSYHATLIDISEKVSCKGDVLRSCFRKLMSDEYNYDAFVVFDADNVVDNNFLTEMNHAILSGVRIAQGNRFAKNPYDNWLTGAYSIYFSMISRLFNHARNQVNLSAFIGGTGFVLTKDVVKENGGWNTNTMSEDSEFSMDQILKKEKIVFVADAITYDEQPASLAISIKQRKRWSSGMMTLCDKYFSLFSDNKDVSFFQKIDCILNLLSPYIQIVSIVPLFINILLQLIYRNQQELIYVILWWIISSYIGSVLLAALILRRTKKISVKDLKGILSFWFFALTWIPINISCLFHKPIQWEQIKHTKSHSL